MGACCMTFAIAWRLQMRIAAERKTVMMKNVAISLFLAAAAVGATLDAAVIKGRLVDATDTTATLVEASVKLLKADKDSAFVAGTTADADGVWSLDGVGEGHYLVKFSYVGYADRTLKVAVGADGRDVDFGKIMLTPNTVLLKEAVVKGVKTPITVKEDTIEYNADSYKTQANAVVEDLLKRLPGVEVGSDGKITANGKEVKKILVDGKEFFSDDPTVASKNIPANMVNKLQVVDRKSDLARLTGVDDGDDETVINLTVKKGMNNGWFGTVNAGYGTDDRYAASLNANYFRNGNQLTVIGGGNNTNNLGFTDGGASRFQRFGGSRGITTSQMAGINFSVGTNGSQGEDKEKLRVGGDLMYSHSDRDTRQSTARQYLFQDSTSYYNSASSARDKGHNLRGDFRMRWRIDSLSTLEFRPNFQLNFSKSTRADSSMTRAGNALQSPVNSSFSTYNNDGKSYEFGGELVFNHNFMSHPGRSYSAQVRYNYSKVNEDGNTYTQNRYFLKSDSTETIDQIYSNDRRTNGISGRLSWTEPLGNIKNARFLQLSYRGNYRYSTANKMVYDITRATDGSLSNSTLGGYNNFTLLSVLTDPNLRRAIGQEYGSNVLSDGQLLSTVLSLELGPELDRDLNERQSNDFANKYFDQALTVGFRQVRKQYNLNLGASVNSAMSSSEDRMNSARDIPSHWVWTVAPYARFRYRFTRTRSLSFDYRMRSSQPSLTQLQPVADVSNPLNIVVGNPDLKPTFTHRINLRFNDFNQQAQRSIMGMLGVNFAQNSIISTVKYDSTTGGRTTTYANVNGVWDAFGMGMLSLPFSANKSFSFTSHLFTRFSQTVGYNNDAYNRSQTFSINYSPGLAYRTDMFDLEIRPRYNFQTTHNSVQTAVSNNRNIHTYGGQFNGTYSAPFGLVLSTDLSYSATSGYSAGYDTKQWIWNGSIAYQFLKDKKASVMISVYDILGQRKNVNRNVTASYIEDAIYNSLGRYGMLTLTYRFTSFKKGEEPDTRREGFGPDGHGRPPMGGGRPPMGGGRPPMGGGRF